MKMRRLIAAASAAMMVFALTACGGAQGSGGSQAEKKQAGWPSGTVTVTVPASAGGGTDNFTRITTNYLQKKTGQAFTVVNDITGNGTVAYENIRKAEPDGSSLMAYHCTMLIQYYQGIYDKNPADPENFSVIGVLENGGDGDVLVVPANAPYNTLAELVDYCKQNPGVVFGNQNGGFGQLETLLFADKAGIDIKFVDAGAQADTIVALLGGNIQCSFIQAAAAAQYVESGDMKVLAICNKERSENYPEIETFSENGYDVVLQTNMFLFGPAGMDQELKDSISLTIKEMQDDEECIKLRENLANSYTWKNPADSEKEWQELSETIKEMCALAGYDVSAK